MRQGCFLLVIIVFLLALIGQCSGDAGEKAEPSQNTPIIKATPTLARLSDLEKKLGEGSVETMKPDEYPKLYAKLGAKTFARANELAKWAGITAAESAACDTVEIVAVSDRSTSDRIEWFVDCANGERFRPDESVARKTKERWAKAKGDKLQIAGDVSPQSASLASISEVDVVTKCDLAVKEAMTSKNSFDSAWSWDFRRHPTEGRVSVAREFEAKNAFGATIDSEYRCLVDGQTQRLIEISIREPAGWQTIYSNQ